MKKPLSVDVYVNELRRSYRACKRAYRQKADELETCKQAHMSNCLDADKLRTKIRTLESHIAELEAGLLTQQHLNPLDR